MHKTAKIIIDVIAGLLFAVLLGYSFTGGQLHEMLGILFALVIISHNIINRKWYSVFKKGKNSKSKKRMLSVAVNIALIIDTAAIILTGIINSRYLFNTGIRISGVVQIHAVLALVDLVLIISHILVHTIDFTKRNAGKHFICGTVIALILAVLLYTWLLPYVKRHFDTVRINCEEVITGEHIDVGTRKTAIVHFTRVGNSDFEDNVDAVSGASLLLNEEDKLMGNSQVLAQMVEDAVAGDLISINVETKYPSSYSDTVSQASNEIKSGEIPTLIEMPESLNEYDTVILVYPLWWWTIPKPVEAFLRSYDFSNKTVIPIVTHGGSGAGDSIKDIKSVCRGTVIEDPLTVYCGDIPYCRDTVSEWLKEILSELPVNAYKDS